MAYVIRDPLIRIILVLLSILISVFIAIIVLGLYFSIIEGKLVFKGAVSITDIYGEIIGGILVLGWGFVIPVYFATRRRSSRYFSNDIMNAIEMYYNGSITKDELIQIIDREKTKQY